MKAMIIAWYSMGEVGLLSSSISTLNLCLNLFDFCNVPAYIMILTKHTLSGIQFTTKCEI